MQAERGRDLAVGPMRRGVLRAVVVVVMMRWGRIACWRRHNLMTNYCVASLLLSSLAKAFPTFADAHSVCSCFHGMDHRSISKLRSFGNRRTA